MNNAARAGIGVIAAVIGFLIGGLIAFYCIHLLAPLVFGHEFYQIAWLFAGFGVPGFSILGAIVATSMSVKQPRRFAAIFVPLAIFFLVLEVSHYHLRRVEKPRQYVIEVETEDARVSGRLPSTGRKVIGTIEADGMLHEVEGTIPVEFTVEAIRIDYEITLIDGQDDEWFSVVVSVDGGHDESMSSDLRISGQVECMGIGWWARTVHPKQAELRRFARAKEKAPQ